MQTKQHEVSYKEAIRRLEKKKKISFARYVWDHWEKLGPPTDEHMEQMYNQWMKKDEANNKAGSTG